MIVNIFDREHLTKEIACARKYIQRVLRDKRNLVSIQMARRRGKKYFDFDLTINGGDYEVAVCTSQSGYYSSYFYTIVQTEHGAYRVESYIYTEAIAVFPPHYIKRCNERGNDYDMPIRWYDYEKDGENYAIALYDNGDVSILKKYGNIRVGITYLNKNMTTKSWAELLEQDPTILNKCIDKSFLPKKIEKKFAVYK